MLPLVLVGSGRKLAVELEKALKETSVSSSMVFRYSPIKKTFTIDLAREINALVAEAMSPIVIVIDGLDTARTETQNAMLKTLEDGAGKVSFILTVREEHNLLSTVLSRVRVKRVSDKLADDLILAETLLDPELSIEKKMSLCSGITSVGAIKTCNGLIKILETGLKNSDKSNTSLIKEIIQTRYLIQKVNLSPEHAIDHLIRQINAN